MDDFMTQIQCEEFEYFGGCEGEQAYVDYIASLQAEGHDCPDCAISL